MMLHVNDQVIVNDGFHQEAKGTVKGQSRCMFLWWQYEYLISFDSFSMPACWIHERYITSLEEDEEIGYYPAQVKW